MDYADYGFHPATGQTNVGHAIDARALSVRGIPHRKTPHDPTTEMDKARKSRMTAGTIADHRNTDAVSVIGPIRS